MSLGGNLILSANCAELVFAPMFFQLSAKLSNEQLTLSGTLVTSIDLYRITFRDKFLSRLSKDFVGA